MAYGISIINSAGATIISETYQNYHLVSSGTTANSVALPTLAAGDILLVRPSAVGGTLWMSTINPSHISSTTGYVTWAVVRERPTASGQQYGLLIKTAAGAVAFDSNRRGMLPVYILRYPQQPYSSSITVTMPFAPLTGRLRYINASSIRITGIAESGTGMFDYWRCTYVTWNSDMSITLNEGDPGIDYNDLAPGGTTFPIWGGTMIYSFADV